LPHRDVIGVQSIYQVKPPKWQHWLPLSNTKGPRSPSPNEEGIDHVYIRQIGVNCKDLAITEQADCGKVLIEDQVSSPGRVVQR